jgi:class 3 adenylate cyclase/HAMP domain-containing protein
MKSRAIIRYKIVLVVIPILVITAAFIGMTSYFSARNGITGVAKEFLGYKLNELYNYSSRQLGVIREMNLTNDPSLLGNAKDSIVDYSGTVIASKTGAFLAIRQTGGVDFGTMSNVSSIDTTAILKSIGTKKSGWLEFELLGVPKVGVFIQYLDWNDYFLIMDDRKVFYEPVNEILQYVLYILAAAVVLSSILLLFYIARLTSPINSFVDTIQGITQDMDLTRRVKIVYNDEIGQLAHYFNQMVAELESAYNQIKNYAYQTVLAKNKEERIRFIFQKYVPSEVINTILNLSSDSMLIGKRQPVTLMFSDIRDFTTISEGLSPEELVLSLNTYFDRMVREISDRNGEVDKFIGDAIMAIFGAPVSRPDDPENSVRAAIAMIKALELFNEDQRKKGKTVFRIGIGINTGEVIVGNIGSEKKVNYTVIGDAVNLASRLEGLTKKYKVRIIVSEFTRDLIPAGRFTYRELDNVRVKGKSRPVKIFEPYDVEASRSDMEFFAEYHRALALYVKGDFQKGKDAFAKLSEERKDDYLSRMYLERCEYLITNPPQEAWDGVETWHEK